ncbi:MAG: hypothetical protein ACT4RN_14075 [Pseudonocardia sp.]
MTGPNEPPTPVPGAGSDRALFDEHYAGVLATAATQRWDAPGGGGGFVVDPDAYRAAIDELTAAVRELEAGQRRWRGRRTDAIGIDPVSVQLRINIDEMRRRSVAYVHAWTEQIRETRDALVAQLAAYEATEHANAERLT